MDKTSDTDVLNNEVLGGERAVATTNKFPTHHREGKYMNLPKNWGEQEVSVCEVTHSDHTYTHTPLYCTFDPDNDNFSKQKSWHFRSVWMTCGPQRSLKTCLPQIFLCFPSNFYSASEKKINSGWTVVWEEGGFAKRCYWSLYSWNNLYGLASAASSLINVCQKPGSGLPGVRALRNNASHHQQEWQKRSKWKGRPGRGGAGGEGVGVRVGRSGRDGVKKRERLSQTFEILGREIMCQQLRTKKLKSGQS